MRRNSWIALLVLTIAFTAAAALVLDRRAERLAVQTYGQPLFPDLADRINRIATLEFATGQGTWTLSRDAAGVWHHDARSGYPADADQVKRLAVALSRATVVAPKTADPALYDRLRVGEPRQLGADEDPDKVRTSVRVVARDGDGTEMAGLIIGKTAKRATSTDPAEIYVRRTGEDRSWLARGFLDVKQKPTEWLDQDLFKVTKDRVRTIRVARADAEPLILERNDQDAIHVRDLPDTLREKEIRITSTARALEFVKPRDVRPVDEVDFAAAVTTTFTTRDGWTVTVDTVPAGFRTEDSDAYWLRFAIDFDRAAIPADSGIDADAAAAQAAKALETVKGWAYLLPEFTAQNFLPTLTSLTETKEES